MSPTPKRQPMVTCPNCGALNDPARGSKYCFSCNMPLSQTVTPFTFPDTGQEVRVVTIDGDPWFVGRDATAILGYRTTNDGTRWLDEDEKGTHMVRTLGGDQEMVIVSEPGLYSLILRSKRETAKAFKRWVTHDVLPEIRRTGSYQAAPTHPLPRTFSEALRELADAVEQRDAAEQRITELQPAADAWEKLADAKGDYSVRDAAQILSRDPLISTGQNRLFAYLRQIGWIDKNGIPYQSQVDLGRLFRRTYSFTHQATGEDRPAAQVRVTPKGLKELRIRLAGQQQLVVIEGGA